MTIDEALRTATRRLSPRSSSPRLDAELLLGYLLHMERAALLARPMLEIEPASRATDYGALIARRELGEPIAYIVGHKEFYGLDLTITRDVLVPRPETESLVDECLKALPDDEISHMADIGTGSGAVVVAVATHRPRLLAFATDISAPAIEVARENCVRHAVADRVKLSVGDLLQPLDKKVRLIAANLPYVSPGEAEPDVATWEPHEAVFGGGTDGTELLRRFLQQAPHYLVPGGTVVMETAYSQGTVVSQLAKEAFPGASVQVRKDLAGYDRIIIIETS